MFAFSFNNIIQRYFSNNRFFGLIQLAILPLLTLCQKEVAFHVIPAPFVYAIVEHNDSIYYSTPDGELFCFHPDNPNSSVLVAHLKGYPIRGFTFKKDGTLYTSSYQTGIHRLSVDTLFQEPKMGREAWAMKLDYFDNIWLATRWGVFRQNHDTLIKFSNLHEAYDIDFFQSCLAVAHRSGITLYDTSSGRIKQHFSFNAIFWTIDIFDSLLAGGGVQTCALINNHNNQFIPLERSNNIPWSFAKDKNDNLFMGTEKGLYRIRNGDKKARCIGFKDKCIKSLLVDSKGQLWVGRFFKQ